MKKSIKRKQLKKKITRRKKKEQEVRNVFKTPQPLQEMVQNQSSRNPSSRNILVYLLVIIGIFILLNLIMLALQASNPIEKPLEKEKEKPKEISYEPSIFITTGNETVVEMKLPAVDVNKTGVVTTLKIAAKPGTGRTLVDIEGLLFWADTQQSIRVARQVAADITKIDIEKIDLTYTIKAEASLIGGPSAGSALAIATIAALQGKKPADNVMMTGTINHDGTIGPVSEILEKAKAAKQGGATLFLVPLLQSRDVVYETTEHCEQYGSTEFCTQETKPRKVDVGKEAGIEIIEVSSVQEAMEYYFK